MKGVQFIVNEKGAKTAVVIDLKHHRDLWEDFYDRMLIQQRENEPRESIDEVRQRLQEAGKLPRT